MSKRRIVLLTLTISALTLFSCTFNAPVSIHIYTDTNEYDDTPVRAAGQEGNE